MWRSKLGGQTVGDIRNSNWSVQNWTMPLVSCQTLKCKSSPWSLFPFSNFQYIVTIYSTRRQMMFLWYNNRTPWKQHMALSLQRLSDSEILQSCSTSPSVEGPDFVENSRRYQMSNTLRIRLYLLALSSEFQNVLPPNYLCPLSLKNVTWKIVTYNSIHYIQMPGVTYWMFSPSITGSGLI